MRRVLVGVPPQVKMTVRSRMGHAVADKLVYNCHEALHLKESAAVEEAGERSLGAEGREMRHLL